MKDNFFIFLKIVLVGLASYLILVSATSNDTLLIIKVFVFFINITIISYLGLFITKTINFIKSKVYEKRSDKLFMEQMIRQTRPDAKTWEELKKERGIVEYGTIYTPIGNKGE